MIEPTEWSDVSHNYERVDLMYLAGQPCPDTLGPVAHGSPRLRTCDRLREGTVGPTELMRKPLMRSAVVALTRIVGREFPTCSSTELSPSPGATTTSRHRLAVAERRKHTRILGPPFGPASKPRPEMRRALSDAFVLTLQGLILCSQLFASRPCKQPTQI